MGFKRDLLSKLKDWKSKDERKPLIIRGARQVGKTTLIKDFARLYPHTILLNLEKPTDRHYFEQFDSVQKIIESLFFTHGIPSTALDRTLLFIDEIQESPKAIQFLRYFYEELSKLHVISAGSLLEFALQQVESFPVGRVEYLYLHPLNFPEYLEAINKPTWREALTQIPLNPATHTTLMEAFHHYVIIGGMPEIVKNDQQNQHLSDLVSIYESIWTTYKNDVEKYSSNDTERKIIKHLMDTATFYLDERVKFQGFGNSNYRSREIGEAFRTLDAARVIRLIYPSTDVVPPPRMDLKKSPRLQFLDTGLVNYTLGIQGDLLGMKDLSTAYKGSLIPHVVMQEFTSIQQHTDHKPMFWVRDKTQSNAEVDLIMVSGQKLIPIEIKSGATGSLRSLHQFIERTDHSLAIRVYGGEFRLEKANTPNGKPYTLLNIPYYATTMLPKYGAWLIENQTYQNV